MKLSLNSLAERAFWQAHGYDLPEYDVAEIIEATRQSPLWLHLGAGNIFRAFLAHAQQRLLNQGDGTRGIIVAEGFDTEIIERVYQPADNLSIFARLKSDESVDKIVLASVVESLRMDSAFAEDFARLKDIVAHPDLQMISLPQGRHQDLATVTEKSNRPGTPDPSESAHRHRPTGPTLRVSPEGIQAIPKRLRVPPAESKS